MRITGYRDGTGLERSVVNSRFRCYVRGNPAESGPVVQRSFSCLRSAPNARRRSHFKPAQSRAKSAGTRREPVVAMGAWPAGFVCDSRSGVVVGTTERPALPSVGNSRRAFLACHLVRHLCFRAQARGFGAQADSERVSESFLSHTLRGATGSARPVDHAFAAQLQRAYRFPGGRGVRYLARWNPENRQPANLRDSRRSLFRTGWSQTWGFPGGSTARRDFRKPGTLPGEAKLVGSGRGPS